MEPDSEEGRVASSQWVKNLSRRWKRGAEGGRCEQRGRGEQRGREEQRGTEGSRGSREERRGAGLS